MLFFVYVHAKCNVLFVCVFACASLSTAYMSTCASVYV